MVVHLATHSYYSLLNGIPKPSELATAASAAGHQAIALADHNRLTGAIEFTLACQAEYYGLWSQYLLAPKNPAYDQKDAAAAVGVRLLQCSHAPLL